MAKMGSVDELFGNDIIDDVAANTEDAQITFDSFGNPDHSRTDENDLVEIDDASFDELFAAAELADVGSGIGEADDGFDGEGVPIPEELQGGEEPKKKKDKRTARSQAHAKKKASSYDALPDEEADGTDGIGGADLMESSIMAEDDDPVAMSGYTETEEILDISHRPKTKSKKKTPVKSEIIYETEEVSDTDFEYEDDGYEQVDLPDWADSIRRKVNANVAHAFLLNGNVRDYMVRNISIIDGIVAVLDPEYENFDIIARYDQAHGISFYGHDIETGGTLSAAGTPRTLADAYKERFIAEMKESQIRMSVPATEEIPNRDPVALFTIISDMFDHPSKTREAKILLFIDYSDLLVPDASSAQMKPEERKLAITLADIGRSQAADDAGNVMIFITDDMTQLSTRIRSAESRIEQIKIPIPNRAEREDFIENVLDVPENVLSDGTQVFAHADSISKETFAINSAGLSRIQIEDIVLRALSEDEPLSMQLMKERKQEIIREDYDDVLEIIDPKNGFEKIGGMEYLKEFFVQEVIEPVHAGEREAVAMGCLLTGAPGVGKSCSIWSTLYTENGPVYAKDIQLKDKVFARDGKAYEVQGVFPQGALPAYEVKLSDGRTVICSEDHIWTVRSKSHGKYIERNRTVKEMLEHGVLDVYAADIRTGRNGHAHYFIPQCAPVELPAREQSVDPYVMGAFLGDGSGTSTHVVITCDERDIDIVENMAQILGLPYKSTVLKEPFLHWVFVKEFRTAKTGKSRDQLLQAKDLFKDYPEVRCKAVDKFIPDDYKYGSIEQRYALLQGLMDTDGGINQGTDSNRYNTRFGSTSERLARDVMFIANSLGYSCTISCEGRAGEPIKGSLEKYGKQYYHKNDQYEVRFNIPNDEKQKLFRCKRKLATALEAKEHKKRRHYEHVSIEDIRPLDCEEEMVCFQVASPDHTYLVNDCVVTHNTMISKAVAKEAGMNFVALNLNRIMEKWVGSTERNLDRALDCALAMAPTIIFIDEIDEALPNRADPNASSVNKRINQRLLTFFSDTTHRGEVIILAATNYPEKIDPAFKRAGRFDVRVPVFAPDGFDRMRIMRAIAGGRGYSFSWFEDPDKLVDNPFTRAEEWVREGNVPQVRENVFVGDREMYTYTITNALGTPERHDVYLPCRLINILGRDKITLQELYENINILLADMPTRQPDASTGEIETDEVYSAMILEYLHTKTGILGSDSRNIKMLHKRIWRWETIYSTFIDQTFRMTGAELDVVMNKAINLFKKWKRRVGQDKVDLAIEKKIMADEKDIPWSPFLLDACRKTVNAVAGIKEMEDMALINTSDTDFIPDALYAELDDGRQISYRERHEELAAKQTKSTLG